MLTPDDYAVIESKANLIYEQGVIEIKKFFDGFPHLDIQIESFSPSMSVNTTYDIVNKNLDQSAVRLQWSVQGKFSFLDHKDIEIDWSVSSSSPLDMSAFSMYRILTLVSSKIVGAINSTINDAYKDSFNTITRQKTFDLLNFFTDVFTYLHNMPYPLFLGKSLNDPIDLTFIRSFLHYTSPIMQRRFRSDFRNEEYNKHILVYSNLLNLIKDTPGLAHAMHKIAEYSFSTIQDTHVDNDFSLFLESLRPVLEELNVSFYHDHEGYVLLFRTNVLSFRLRPKGKYVLGSSNSNLVRRARLYFDLQKI